MEDKSDNLGCSECVDLLADYVDGALPREQAEQARVASRLVPALRGLRQDV